MFFDYATKKLSILRNKKLFNIDVDKLYVQEIPTYEVDVGVIELLFPKKRSRVLLLESRDLVGLQNLGNEIGWISTPNGKAERRAAIPVNHEPNAPWNTSHSTLNTLCGKGNRKVSLVHSGAS